jgi:hypothetical protein
MQCSFCGSTLKDDARYCNQCGTLVASHPFSPKSSAFGAFNKAGGAIPEQISEKPNRVARRLQDEPPSWMSFLENELRSKVPSGELESERRERPTTADAKNETLAGGIL